MFRNVNFSNFEKSSQRKPKTDTSSECIFIAPAGTNFENFSGCGFDKCIDLPEETGYVIYMYIYI